MEEEKEVQAEEMTEQETSDFEEAFSEADAVEEAGGQEAEEAEEESEGEETPDDEPQEDEEKEEEPPQKIMVNGREYTQEELAQALSEPPKGYGVLEQLANDAGMNLDDYLANVDERYAASQVESRTAQLVSQGIEENFAKHIAETEMENARFKAGAEINQQAEAMREETQDQAETRMEAEIAEFDRVYPDIKEIPPEVIEEIKKTGHSPVVAYQNYLLQKQEVELKALKQAKKNKETLPGPAKGTQAGKKDEFSEAFTGALNE